jgi:lipopolysaccharide/colanic/teichoic acid biosynthesis glycosyltransferase
LSIDELPQLWNVLKGDMSLVGPRPPLPEECSVYTERERQRLAVRPGLTCVWQISGRSNIDFNAWVEMDLEYIRSWRLSRDFKILLLTVPAVLTARGAW